MKRIAVWILLCILLCPLMQVQAEDITDLTIETVTFDNGNPGLSAVEEAVNQITIPLSACGFTCWMLAFNSMHSESA